jgi:hypothetical protein
LGRIIDPSFVRDAAQQFIVATARWGGSSIRRPCATQRGNSSLPLRVGADHRSVVRARRSAAIHRCHNASGRIIDPSSARDAERQFIAATTRRGRIIDPSSVRDAARRSNSSFRA